MKVFTEPTIEVVKFEADDIICESINYSDLFDKDGHDLVGWG